MQQTLPNSFFNYRRILIKKENKSANNNRDQLNTKIVYPPKNKNIKEEVLNDSSSMFFLQIISKPKL